MTNEQKQEREQERKINSPMNFDIVKPKFVLIRRVDTGGLDELLDIPPGMSKYVRCYYEVFLVDLHLAWHACSYEALARCIFLYNGVECSNPDGGDLPDEVQDWQGNGPESEVDHDDIDVAMDVVERDVARGVEGEDYRWVYTDEKERDVEMAEHVDDADGDHDKAYKLWVEDLREWYQGNHAL